jgi:uncharacterized metal-binding protein
MTKLSPSQIVAFDDWAQFPAIASALSEIERTQLALAMAKQSGDKLAIEGAEINLGCARSMLRRAELQRDIALGFTDLWTQAERESAAMLGLI